MFLKNDLLVDGDHKVWKASISTFSGTRGIKTNSAISIISGEQFGDDVNFRISGHIIITLFMANVIGFTVKAVLT
jgi:hypothetical protein